MLRQRLLTAFVIIVVVVSAILWLPADGFSLFIAAVILLGAWEWGGLFKLRTSQRLAYCGITAALIAALATANAAVMPLMVISAVWWLVAFNLVLRYPSGGTWWQARPVALVIGLIVLVPGFAALRALRGQDDYVAAISLFIVLVAAADSFAYFTGRAFGKRRLAPFVSPNKSWEGVFGGMAGCMTLGLIVWWLSGERVFSLADWLTAGVGCLLLAAFSVVGDLFESMAKRHCQVKDSGTLLPGHGGVLDRLDSLTAALPVYVLILQALRIY
jgi:phosphatidate cytidylyltransferase